MTAFELLQGDCLQQLATLPAASVQCCVTSPPYWGLRDYGTAGQLGLEATPDEYVANMVAVFSEVRRVLRDDGTLWLNLGDSYAASTKQTGRNDATTRNQIMGYRKVDNTQESGAKVKTRVELGELKPKDLVGIPWRVAFALQADGWWLRQDIIWHKPNPMPESVTDRCTKAHEYIFLLTKAARYFYDAAAVASPIAESTIRIHSSAGVNARGTGADWKQYHVGQGHSGLVNGNLRSGTRNKRSVWTVTTKPFKGAHFATFPPDLIEPCILAGSAADTLVLDPFSGAGTTGVVAVQHGRRYIGIELNPQYLEMSRKRIQLVRDSLTVPMFADA